MFEKYLKKVLLYQNIVYFYIRNQNNQKLKTKKMKKVIIKTKSNFRNLNGTIQDVFEIVGTRVTCLISIDFRLMQVDFHINEVKFI